jgi:hypothetical protein
LDLSNVAGSSKEVKGVTLVPTFAFVEDIAFYGGTID